MNDAHRREAGVHLLKEVVGHSAGNQGGRGHAMCCSGTGGEEGNVFNKLDDYPVQLLCGGFGFDAPCTRAEGCDIISSLVFCHIR